MTIEYDIVCELNIQDLIIRVNKLIKCGWQPQGGICVYDDTEDEWFYQAMTIKRGKYK